MRKAARLLWLFVRLGVQQELAYRGNLAGQAVLSGTNLAASLAFLAVVYGRTESLAGWRPPELLALWGVFHVLTGLLGAVVQPSLQRLVEDVHRVAFATTVPAEALRGRLEPATLVAAAAFAGWLLLASRWLWLRGLRRYSGAS